MSRVVPMLRAVVRDELAAVQPLALAAVTAVDTNGDGSGKRNIEVNAQLHGSDLELQRVPVVTGRVGISMPPRVGDTVVVAFLHGDLNGPVVLGSLYDDQRHPPKAAADELVYEVPDDAASVRRIEIKTASGHTVTIHDDDVKVVMGGTTLEIAADGAVNVACATDFVIDAKGDVTIKAGKNVSVKAGINADIEASANATVKAGAQATLKGSITSIAGQTSFSMG
jgi:phage baseplate assembly protein gpV